MRHTLLERCIAALIVVVFFGIVLHAPVTVFISSVWPGVALPAKAWKEVLIILGLLLLATVVTMRKSWPIIYNDWLVRFSLLYVALHVVMAVLMWSEWSQVVAGLLIDLRYVGFFLLVYGAVQLLPDMRPQLLRAGVAGAVIVIGFGVLQLFLPPDILRHIGYDKQTTIAPYLTVDENPEYVRINSTLRGPNPLGAYVVIVLALGAAAIAKKKWQLTSWKRMVITVAGFAASVAVLWASYSRSAKGAALIALGCIVLLAYWHKLSWKIIVAAAVAAGLLLGGLYVSRESDFVSHVILHEDPNEGNAVNSNDGHFESLENGVELMARQPYGAGVGSTGSASLQGENPIIIENQYLFIAHEVGWAGLALFMVLFGTILYRLWRRRDDWLALGVLASGIGLAAIGLLLPVWVDDTVSIVWWGLAAIALAHKGGK